MKDIEEKLKKEGLRIDCLKAPNELEDRLRNALNNHNAPRQRGYRRIVKVAAILVVIITLSYHFDTLAYYTKRLVGYDSLMKGSLRELNELGKGQVIEKSHTFANGLKFTLDGIMLDENQMLVFYSIKAPPGREDLVDSNISMYFKGFLKMYHQRWGHGEINEANNEIKWVTSFDPPSFLDKKLQLTLDLTGKDAETAEIVFTIDREKAMGHTLKKTLDETAEAEDIRLTFQSIIASPTQTTIKGSLQKFISLAIDTLEGERIRPQELSFDLIANGKALEHQAGGLKTDSNGITFHKEFDPLPEDLESLQIHLKSLQIDRDANQKLPLSQIKKDHELVVKGQTVIINGVYEEGDHTYITLTTADHVKLSSVRLIIGGERTPLQETIESEHTNGGDGSIWHTRTLRFPVKGPDAVLLFERISYSQEFDQVIDIPL